MLQALLATGNSSFWLPERASSVAESSDNLFYFILGINIFFSTLIMALLIWFVIRYRHRGGPESNKPHDPTGGHSTALELTWTIIPTLLVLIIFWYGFRGYLHASVMPPNAYEVTATGKMWNWSFAYPEGFSDDELHLVVNRPAVMVLQSTDVIHDLDIPAFRMKRDAVPGRYNRTWFEPTVKGEYQVFCAMYCGQNHSTMLAKCVVEDETSFRRWVDAKMNWRLSESFIDRGKELHARAGCATCHTVDGSKGTGPSWLNVYNSMVPLEGGGKVLADDAYIHESIVLPAAKIVQGFPNVMPPGYGDQLKPDDITAITWYLKSISTNYHGDLAPGKIIATAKGAKGGPGVAPVTQPAAAPGVLPKGPLLH